MKIEPFEDLQTACSDAVKPLFGLFRQVQHAKEQSFVKDTYFLSIVMKSKRGFAP
jgi:hypothetical protein